VPVADGEPVIQVPCACASTCGTNARNLRAGDASCGLRARRQEMAEFMLVPAERFLGRVTCSSTGDDPASEPSRARRAAAAVVQGSVGRVVEPSDDVVIVMGPDRIGNAQRPDLAAHAVRAPYRQRGRRDVAGRRPSRSGRTPPRSDPRRHRRAAVRGREGASASTRDSLNRAVRRSSARQSGTREARSRNAFAASRRQRRRADPNLITLQAGRPDRIGEHSRRLRLRDPPLRSLERGHIAPRRWITHRFGCPTCSTPSSRGRGRRIKVEVMP